MAPDCDMAIVHDDNLACIGSNVGLSVYRSMGLLTSFL